LLTPADTNGYEVLGKAESLNPNRIGSIARDFRFKNVETGQIESLHDLYGIFKIIFFYDPDCHHCKEVFPKAQALHDSIIDRGVSFLAMSVTRSENDVSEFRKTLNPKSSSVRFGYEERNGDFIGKYYIPVTPGIYILDANNRVKARGISITDLRELMKTFVGAF
jgi:thiol-disulfide isomerase/thioredoxin